jgi:hypothetical protein
MEIKNAEGEGEMPRGKIIIEEVLSFQARIKPI